MAEKEYIERELVETYLEESAEGLKGTPLFAELLLQCRDGVKRMPVADVVEVDKVAEMLRLMFDDDCACNYNSNDEWLPFKCQYGETDCPTPKEANACWKEFVKHFLAKMDGGTE